MVVSFIKKLLFLLLSVMVSGVIICLLPGETFLNVFPDKQQFLRTSTAPRMIFVGGSSLMYGLDSHCVEEAFGLPVVNTGLHGGLGLRFMLEHVRPYIQKGDILVVVPEYGVLSQGYDFNAPTTATLVFTDPRGKIDHLSLRDYIEALRGFPSVAYSKVVVRPITRLSASQNPFLYPAPFYWRGFFNSNGDIIVHLKASKSLLPDDLKKYPPIESDIGESVVMLKDFAEYTTSHGARIFLAFPPMVDTRYQQNASSIAEIHDQLKQGLGMPIVSLPSDYIYPINYFYDSPEHLTAKGRKMRTERLIADLRQTQPNITYMATTINTCADVSKP
jgi:hypothetical protein